MGKFENASGKCAGSKWASGENEIGV